MEPLKEMFNVAYYKQFAGVFGTVYPGFDTKHFLKDATANLVDLSLNERLRHTSVTLARYLPDGFEDSLAVLQQVAPLLKTGYTALVLPDFVALYGKEHIDLSLKALRYFTTFGSSEFAIREFLRTDLKKTLKVMLGWAKDPNHHVRRLASEGSRPRLPWSFRLDEIIRNPELTAPILNALRQDEHLYVKKSVANHLNDFTRDNEDYMLRLVKTWDIGNEHTKWIIKHACRNLIKKGNQEALALFLFEKQVDVQFSRFALSTTDIRLGETLSFSFNISSKKTSVQKLVVDYAVHYARGSGKSSRKVFKLRELMLLPGQTVTLARKQLFMDLTTRRHFGGRHTVEILINGVSMAKKHFQLQVPQS